MTRHAHYDFYYIDAINLHSGVICTTDESVRDNIIHAVALPHSTRVFPVGRLDKESTGLVSE